MTVPTGVNGKPMALVRNGATEKIPTVQFGNVDIGPAYVEKYVEDEPQAIVNGLLECFQASQKVLGGIREALLEEIKTAGIR